LIQILGTCELFEEKRVGDERYNILTGCPGSKSASIVLRGGGEQFLAETKRSIHDALSIVRRCMKDIKFNQGGIVGGGGAIEMRFHKILIFKVFLW